MPRYAKQRDNFRCGPFAILNVLKWAGINNYNGLRVNSYLAKTELQDLCRCDEDGTGLKDFDRAIRTIEEISVRRIWKVKPHQIIEHLEDDGAAVIGFDYIKKNVRHGHFALFVEFNKFFTCINHKDQSTYFMSRREFNRMFNKNFDPPSAWLITID